jgi:hypothetical protein
MQIPATFLIDGKIMLCLTIEILTENDTSSGSLLRYNRLIPSAIECIQGQ